MNYERIYESIVARGKERVTVEGYSERHHIIPRCLGGSDDEENLVTLTAEEHYVVHQLLVKMHPQEASLWYAATMMGSTRTNNKLYGWLKKRASEARTKKHVIKHCIVCNKAMELTEHLAAKRTTCSRQCQNGGRRIEHSCIHCGSTFNVPKHKIRKYCSHECVWAFKRAHKIF